MAAIRRCAWQIELALKQARYEAGLARRQYDAVDPDNRLVASELERRWNEKLIEVRGLEEQIETMEAQQPSALSDNERTALMRLGADLELAWTHPAATMATRKRIIRAVLNEIVVRIEDGYLDLVMHWQGGDHTALKVKKNATGKHRWTVAEETEVLVRDLARLMPDKTMAAVLNRAGKSTGRNNGWTQSRVCTFRNHRGIEVYREGERLERGELTLNEAAASLNVSPMTVLRMIRRGVIPARQLCKGAPWVIKAQDISAETVKEEAEVRRKRPLTADPDQQQLSFQ